MKLQEWLDGHPEADYRKDAAHIYCPAHGEAEGSNPSLRVSIAPNKDTGRVEPRFVCQSQHCNWRDIMAGLGMTLAQFKALDVEGVQFAESAAAAKTPLEADDIEDLAVRVRLAHYALMNHKPEALEYAERFGVTREDAERFKLGWSCQLPPATDKGAARLVVPFCDRDGVARGMQARRLENPPKAEEGKRPRWTGETGSSWAVAGFFPGAGAPDQPTVMLCEGPGDALTAACVLGMDSIAIRGAGQGTRPEVATEEILPMLAGAPAVIAGDADAAGSRFTDKLAANLLAHGVPVRVLPFPEHRARKGFDLTDWFHEAGEDFYGEVMGALASAVELEAPSTELAPVEPLEGELIAPDEDAKAQELDLMTDVVAAMSDMARLAEMVREHIASKGSAVRYIDAEDRWLLYQPSKGYWTRVSAGRVTQEVQSFVRRVRALQGEVSTRQQEAAVTNALAALTMYTESVLKQLRSMDGVWLADGSVLDDRPFLVAFENCTIDAEQGYERNADGSLKLSPGGKPYVTRLPHNPDYLLTTRSAVPREYDPDAPADTFLHLIDSAFPEAERPGMRTHILRTLGYGMTGLIGQPRAMVYMEGFEGANGKSKLAEAVENALNGCRGGTEPRMVVAMNATALQGNSTDGEQAARAGHRIEGARFVMANEASRSAPYSEGYLNQLTSGDTTDARALRKDARSFKPKALILVASNYPPQFTEGGRSIYQRLYLWKFTKSFDVGMPGHDPELEPKLMAEGQGIASLLAGQMVEYVEHRADYENPLAAPDEVAAERESLRASNNPLRGWFPGWWRVDKSCTERYSATELTRISKVKVGHLVYDLSYQHYALDIENRPPHKVWDASSVLRRMLSLGATEVVDASLPEAYLTGIRPLTAEELEALPRHRRPRASTAGGGVLGNGLAAPEAVAGSWEELEDN